MKLHYRYVMPTLAAIVVTASAALAQLPANGPQHRANRTPPTAEQIAARQAQFCTDRQAMQAARFTYMEERLKLTPAQKPLFERWKAAVQGQEASRQADCAKPRPARDPNAARPTLPERNARMEEMLKTRLASLEATRGPQEALYNALSAEQKPLFDHAGHRGGMGRGFGGRENGGHRGFGGPGFGGRAMGGPGFGRGPAGPGGPGGAN